MLRNKRLTRQVTVPVSAGLLTDTDSYFDALTCYRQGDTAPIVERLSAASVLAVANGRHLVRDLRSIRDEFTSLRADAVSYALRRLEGDPAPRRRS